MATLTPSQKRTRTRRRNAAKRKRMFAERAAKDPKWRLIEAGSGSSEAIRKRLLWFAAERRIPAEAVPKVGPCMTTAVCDFAKEHGLSLDWVLSGELQHLLKMVRGPNPETEALAAVLAQLARLTPRSRDKVRALLAGPVQ